MVWSVLFLWCVVSVGAGGATVVDVDYDDYYKYIKKNDVFMLEFYAPWCGHCKSFAADYEKAAVELKGKAVLGKVDATEDLELASEYDVQGYPTILLFKKGRKTPVKYEGEREVSAVVQFVNKWLGPAVSSPTTVEELTELTRKKDTIVVLGLFDGQSKKERKAFNKFADEERTEYDFVAVDTTAVSLPAEYTQAGVPSMRVFPPATEAPVAELGVSTSFKAPKIMGKWIYANSFPLVAHLPSSALEKRIVDRGLPILRIFADTDKEDCPFPAAAQSVASTSKGKLSVSIHNMKTEAHRMTEMGIPTDKVAACIVVKDGEKKFCMDEEPTEASLTAYATQYFGGKLKPAIKSQLDEEAVTEEGLTTVTGNSFARDVDDNKDKDVFLEFYAPWCGHCKQLTPKWAELAKKLEGVDTVVIGKVDATANDFDTSKWSVSGYPTLLFRPARQEGKKKAPKPVPYNGAREVADLLEFVKTSATHKFELPTEGGAAAPEE